MRQRRRFKLTYHGDVKKWLLTDNYRLPDDPYYYQTFKYLADATLWIEMNTVKPEDQVVE